MKPTIEAYVGSDLNPKTFSVGDIVTLHIQLEMVQNIDTVDPHLEYKVYHPGFDVHEKDLLGAQQDYPLLRGHLEFPQGADENRIRTASHIFTIVDPSRLEVSYLFRLSTIRWEEYAITHQNGVYRAEKQ